MPRKIPGTKEGIQKSLLNEGRNKWWWIHFLPRQAVPSIPRLKTACLIFHALDLGVPSFLAKWNTYTPSFDMITICWINAWVDGWIDGFLSKSMIYQSLYIPFSLFGSSKQGLRNNYNSFHSFRPHLSSLMSLFFNKKTEASGDHWLTRGLPCTVGSQENIPEYFPHTENCYHDTLPPQVYNIFFLYQMSFLLSSPTFSIVSSHCLYFNSPLLIKGASTLPSPAPPMHAT